jgi:cellulose synthase/poly-beta-1,6-N-acetylglucosamine synthase-like glycosyltransferase
MIETVSGIYLFFIGAAALTHFVSVLRALYYLRVKFPRKLRPGFIAKRQAADPPEPPVTVFVPCKGRSRELKANILAMLGQDHPNYSVIYITESDDDSASDLLAKTASENRRCHHVVAGLAQRCCQKNHNLLEGIRFARRQKIAGDVYVFADMDIHPDRNWIRNIIIPLSDRRIFAVSGFRSLVPGSSGFAEHLHAAFNSLQGLAMTENRYAGMWGGSMAVKRKAFELYQVGEKWATAMVDDLSLTAIIKKHRLKRVYSPDCLVDSKETYTKLSHVLDWLVRQIQYAAVYLRPYTAFGLALNTILALGILVTPISLALAGLRWTPWSLAGFQILFLGVVTVSMALLSSFRKEPAIEFRWLLYAPLFLVLGTYCGWIGFLSRRLVWANVVYCINRSGEVLSIERRPPEMRARAGRL